SRAAAWPRPATPTYTRWRATRPRRDAPGTAASRSSSSDSTLHPREAGRAMKKKILIVALLLLVGGGYEAKGFLLPPAKHREKIKHRIVVALQTGTDLKVDGVLFTDVAVQ